MASHTKKNNLKVNTSVFILSEACFSLFIWKKLENSIVYSRIERPFGILGNPATRLFP